MIRFHREARSLGAPVRGIGRTHRRRRTQRLVQRGGRRAYAYLNLGGDACSALRYCRRQLLHNLRVSIAGGDEVDVVLPRSFSAGGLVGSLSLFAA